MNPHKKPQPDGEIPQQTFTLDEYSVFVHTLKSEIKSAKNLFAWPEIAADLLLGVGRDEAAGRAGRGGIFFFNDHRVATPIAVRQYRHGGIWRFLSGARFFSRKRFLAELAIHQQAARIGLPVPEAVAVIVVKKKRRPVFVRGYFVTEKLADCQTLPEFLQSASGATRLRIFFKLGKYLEKLHKHGIYYTDMQVKNILVDAAGDPCLIDFDKSRIFAEALSRRLRLANLRRFLRSLEKYKSRGGYLLDSDRAAFLIAYAPGIKFYLWLYQELRRCQFWRRLGYRCGWWLNRS